METKVFSIFDNAVKAYLPPLHFRTRGEAIRSVSSALDDPGHQFSKHSQDYVLFELATFDDNTGMFVPHPAPVSCGVLTEFRRAPGDVIPSSQI